MGTVLQGKELRVIRKRYPRKFQRMAVKRMRNCEDVGELTQELGVTRRCLYSGGLNSIWLTQNPKTRQS